MRLPSSVGRSGKVAEKRPGFSATGGTEVSELATVTQLVAELQRGTHRLPYETDIQGLTYLLQEGAGVPLNYRFRMALTCPYSNELRADLERLNAFQFLRLEPDEHGGGNLVSTGASEKWLRARQDRNVSDLVKTLLGRISQFRTSPDLLATAHFVLTRLPEADRKKRRKVYLALAAVRPSLTEEVVKTILTDLDSIRTITFNAKGGGGEKSGPQQDLGM
jgi:hypothetical protein